jgi:hypothetical protein
MTFTASAELPADLLAIWEWGLAQPESGRALALHHAARPEASTEDLLASPVGDREADLYALRRALFGDRMQVVTNCATCGEVVEFDLDASALSTEPLGSGAPEPARSRAARSGSGGSGADGVGEQLRVVADGWVIEFRLPAVADLAAVATGDPATARRALIERCTLSATRDGQPVDPADLPEPLQQRLAAAAERADPAADVTLRINCPDCGSVTPAELDIASYLWVELDSWARDLLLDVHLLASAYGWTEPEILALSPLRRRYYLELCADA